MADTKHLIAEAVTSDYKSYIRPTDGVRWPGDQFGGELKTTNWYDNRKYNGWAHVHRYVNPQYREAIVRNVEDLILCGRIGYGNQTTGRSVNCFSLTRALTAGNYNYNGNTIDYDAWLADGGGINKTGGGFWFDPRGIDAANWKISKLTRECATQCSGLMYIAELMKFGLWAHSADDLKGRGKIYYVSNHVNITFSHPARGERIFDHLGCGKFSDPVPLDYSYTGYTPKCYSVTDVSVTAGSVYAGVPAEHADDLITRRDVVIAFGETMSSTWALSTAKLKDSAGNTVMASGDVPVAKVVYRFLICDTVSVVGGETVYTPLMKKYISHDGTTLEEAEIVINRKEENPDDEQPVASTSQTANDDPDPNPNNLAALSAPTNLQRGDIITSRRENEGRNTTGGHTAMWI